MNTSTGQRWKNGRDSYRPADVIDPRDYEVVPLDGKGSDNLAKAFITQHHYSGTYPAARERVALYHTPSAKLVGCAVFSHPASEAVLANLPCDRLEGVELGRFVLTDDVPGNGESWFLARCRKILRARGYRVLLSHSDPVLRRTLDGTLVLPGHVGFVYQASNAVYGGRSKRTMHVLKPNGTIFSPRSMTKIRQAESGYLRNISELVDLGGRVPTTAELETQPGRAAWMWEVISATCRRLAHGGNHRYLWAIDKKLQKGVAAMAALEEQAPTFVGPPERIAYPKIIDHDGARL